MKYIKEFRDPELIKQMVAKINLGKKVRIMEVCGSHTTAISKAGLREILPDKLELISGPGCPICVTPIDYLERAVKLARKEEVIISTFGDLLSVSAAESSLQVEKSRGCDIRTVYSPLAAVEIARNNPSREVVFLAVGFETTAPTIALSVKQAKALNLTNFSLLSALKTMPPVMKELAAAQELQLAGFLCPGHVSSIIGVKPYQFLARDYDLAGVIAGFETGDIILGITELIEMIKKEESKIKNAYSRVVDYKGNQQALEIIYDLFTTTNSYWRGLGEIKNSGLTLKEEYQSFAAENKFDLELAPREKRSQCSCGEILTGRKRPVDCELFSKVCTPANPVGPCMVSQEGTCAAYYKHESR